MQEKVQVKQRSPRKKASDTIVGEVVKETDVKKPMMYGIATTNLSVGYGTESIEQGEQVDIYEDKGANWLTNKGLVSKLFLLLKKI